MVTVRPMRAPSTITPGGRTCAVLLAAAMLWSGCSGSASSSDGSAALVAVSSTVALEPRPVPTVPPSTVAGQTGTTVPGVVNASPTIVPEPASPDDPASSIAPPTTELVGDPQPIPATTKPPPPPTVVPPPPACDRLAEFDVAGAVTSATGSAASAELASDDVCRYTAGPVVVEVYFVTQAAVRDDWFRRSGVEPVGEVSGDAVGLRSYQPPPGAGAAGAGYTIAALGGRDGVVVAVRGTDDGRFVAGQAAVFAIQAA